MKLREDIQRNRVWIHGSMYVDPLNDEFVPICPECCSDKIEKVPEGQETLALYTCTNCGCEFDAWNGSQRTKLGKAVHAIIIVLMVLIAIAAVGFCIFGAVWAKKKKDELGGNVDGTIILKSFGLGLGIPFLCMIAEAILSKIDDKI